MRTTIIRVDGHRVVPDVEEKPPWQPFTEYDGKPRPSAPHGVAHRARDAAEIAADGRS